ncbi:transposase [Streptomyces sp. ME02-8801-2C]|uniref:transposase n=1 Tax=Streptomyces sp. ME02-8801-2C TaxID=3028680 RepID=UPI0039F6FB41
MPRPGRRGGRRWGKRRWWSVDPWFPPGVGSGEAGEPGGGYRSGARVVGACLLAVSGVHHGSYSRVLALLHGLHVVRVPVVRHRFPVLIGAGPGQPGHHSPHWPHWPPRREIILAETGGDMSQFGTAHHLASWIGVCPGQNESAGVSKSGRTRVGNSNLKRLPGVAAMTARHDRHDHHPEQKLLPARLLLPAGGQARR